ncbi:DNA-processing protein DprA [Candidatus Venteria ishoeyi]|uniref:Uncharacterized protein n=1 Tax=Candidatus Venteria ishoeyi TaxID=1899563 RepID=A0A1H6FH34_9GAMM|nr:DNA-processing protein DprA [Candidatus Venteria ishoeyi]SEH08345.1 Uncharacterised protein [Candidatus Venteria ishoeyi]
MTVSSIAKAPHITATIADEWPYWLALLHTPHVGPVVFAKLLKQFSSPRALLTAGRSSWMEAGMRGRLLAALEKPNWQAVDADFTWLNGHQKRFLLTWDDPRYPAQLREIHDPPPILFGQGNPDLLSRPQLAMVGSRNPSRGGEETAQDFAHHLAQLGWVITSGMAFGIDGASHRGALSATGATVAVLGTGPDKVYPLRHRDLYSRICQQGVIVSEFFPGITPRSGNFPRRNRIISGLSLGTLVVEATLHSGSLITARQAAEQGREVFAIPGSIHNPLAKGCHALIKEGVKLVETAEDIVEELALFAPPLASIPATTQNQTVNEPAPLSEPEKTNLENNILNKDEEKYSQLLAVMVIGEPVPVDSLIERSGLTADAVSSMLLILELQGKVNSAPGGYIRIT